MSQSSLFSTKIFFPDGDLIRPWLFFFRIILIFLFSRSKSIVLINSSIIPTNPILSARPPPISKLIDLLQKQMGKDNPFLGYVVANKQFR